MSTKNKRLDPHHRSCNLIHDETGRNVQFLDPRQVIGARGAEVDHHHRLLQLQSMLDKTVFTHLQRSHINSRRSPWRSIGIIIISVTMKGGHLNELILCPRRFGYAPECRIGR